MTTPPSQLDYAGSSTPATKPRGQLGFLFLALSVISILAAAGMFALTNSARGWDQFAYAMVDRVLLAPQLIALGITAWYAVNPRRRTRIVIAALVTGAIGLVFNLVTVILASN